MNAGCFFDTKVEPFKGRNFNGIQDEATLKTFLSQAKLAHIQVYLGVDVLLWSRDQNFGNTDIFQEHPNWLEQADPDIPLMPVEARYASPFNANVQHSLIQLASELGAKFPDAAGIDLNLKLDNYQILGYSSAARAASIDELGLDPIDLHINGTANEDFSPAAQTWIEWKLAKMSQLLSGMSAAFRATDEHKKIYVSGYTDFYRNRVFSDVRSGQDWMSWVQKVDGVLLEGRWSTDSDDVRAVNGLIHDLKKKSPNSQVILTLSGQHLMQDSEPAKEWAFLNQSQVRPDGFAVLLDEVDNSPFTGLNVAKTDSSAARNWGVGQIAPNFGLVDQKGNSWTLSRAKGNQEVALFIAKDDLLTTSKLPLIMDGLRVLSQSGIKTFILSSKPLDSFKTIFETSPVINLVGAQNDVTSVFGSQSQLIAIDKAGIIRLETPASALDPSSESMAATVRQSFPKVEVGYPAPNFRVIDSKGKIIELDQMRGSKVLLTFFPQCFTSGCAEHLKSVQKEIAGFDLANTKVLAVSVDPSDVQIAFGKSMGLTYPLIPDVGRNLCFLYGTARSTNDLSLRTSFLIDEKGIVRFIDHAVDVTNHGQDMLKVIKKLS